MLPFRQPFPRQSAAETTGGVYFDPKRAGQFRNITSFIIYFTNEIGLLLRDRNFAVSLTPVCGAVIHTVHAVFGSCGPSQMSPIYAATIATIMGGVSLFRRAWAVLNFAHQTRHRNPFTLSSIMGISVSIDSEGPQDAVGCIRFESIQNKIIGFRHSLNIADFRL